LNTRNTSRINFEDNTEFEGNCSILEENWTDHDDIFVAPTSKKLLRKNSLQSEFEFSIEIDKEEKIVVQSLNDLDNGLDMLSPKQGRFRCQSTKDLSPKSSNLFENKNLDEGKINENISLKCDSKTNHLI